MKCNKVCKQAFAITEELARHMRLHSNTEGYNILVKTFKDPAFYNLHKVDDLLLYASLRLGSTEIASFKMHEDFCSTNLSAKLTDKNGNIIVWNKARSTANDNMSWQQVMQTFLDGYFEILDEKLKLH